MANFDERGIQQLAQRDQRRRAQPMSGKLPTYASSSSSSSSKPANRHGGPSSPSTSTSTPSSSLAGSSSTRSRIAIAKSPAIKQMEPSIMYHRYSDDYDHEHEYRQRGRVDSSNDPDDGYTGGANPYAHIQDKRGHRRSHSSDSSSPTSYHRRDPSSSFGSLLQPRRLWEGPRRRHFLQSVSRRIRTRRLLVCLVAGLLLLLLYLFASYEPHIEISFYARRWINDEVDSIQPLSGCFERAEKEGTYNVTQRVWQKTSTWDVHAGLALGRGMDCYDFAGIIGSGRARDTNTKPVPDEERTLFHTYWRTDLAPFGPRQEYMLKSFFTTQPLHKFKLVLWSNGDLTTNSIIYDYMQRFPDSFDVKQADMKAMARGTSLDGTDKLDTQDTRAWVDGDLLRLLALWNYGGVWVDMDSLLTRSLEPLLEHEFVTQWDCYNKPYMPLNGALMHFHKRSPYLCEAFHIMATSPPPRSGSTDWGSFLYYKVWRRLVNAGVPPFKVLPWCFSDGRSCRIDNRLPDPFRKDGEGEGRWVPHSPASSSRGDTASSDSRGSSYRGGSSGRAMGMEDGGLLDEVLHKVFSVHLHNQWEKPFPKDGWVDRLLLTRYEREMVDL